MEIISEVTMYDENRGISYAWTDGFEIQTAIEDGVIYINANKEGLLSMANHLLNLAQDKIPKYHHMHFDEFNSLEDGSIHMIINKV